MTFPHHTLQAGHPSHNHVFQAWLPNQNLRAWWSPGNRLSRLCTMLPVRSLVNYGVSRAELGRYTWSNKRIPMICHVYDQRICGATRISKSPRYIYHVFPLFPPSLVPEFCFLNPHVWWKNHEKSASCNRLDFDVLEKPAIKKIVQFHISSARGWGKSLLDTTVATEHPGWAQQI